MAENNEVTPTSNTSNDEEYQPADTKLFSDIDTLLENHVPIPPLTAEETKEIKDLELKLEEMKNSIADFILILQFNYLITKNSELLVLRRKLLKGLRAAWRQYHDERNEHHFEDRKRLLKNSLDALDRILVENEEWRAANWSVDS